MRSSSVSPAVALFAGVDVDFGWMIGIMLVSIISWPRTTNVTLFPHTAVGDDNFNFFKKVVAFHPLEKIGNAIDVGLVSPHTKKVVLT